MADKTPRVALFIDAENLGAGQADFIIESAKGFGNVFIRRIYADWANPAVQPWRKPIQKHALAPIQQFNYVSGKNTTDIALMLDVMELVFNKQIDTVVLASSDSDFTALIIKLRALGIYTIGIGKDNSHKTLVNACDEFIFPPETTPKTDITKLSVQHPSLIIDQIIEANQPLSLSELGTHLHNQGLKPKQFGYSTLSDWVSSLQKYEIYQDKSVTYIRKWQISPELQQFIDVISHHIDEFGTPPDGWVQISTLGTVLSEHNLTAKKFGYSKLSDLLKGLPHFQVSNSNASVRKSESFNPTTDIKKSQEKESVVKQKFSWLFKLIKPKLNKTNKEKSKSPV